MNETTREANLLIQSSPSEHALNEETSSPLASPESNLRLRAKVWTDPKTHRRYLIPMALWRDVERGRPVTDVLVAYVMRDDDTRPIILTVAEWNALPFFYFREDGCAPRAASRPADVIK
jgi:hypothetical protein